MEPESDRLAELERRLTVAEEKLDRHEQELGIAADVHAQLDTITDELVSIKEMAQRRASKMHRPPPNPRLN
jgi:uncharacterized coiled-coil protein SlyX